MAETTTTITNAEKAVSLESLEEDDDPADE